MANDGPSKTFAEIAFAGPLDGPMVIQDTDVPSRDAAHRAPGRKSKTFGFFDPPRRIGFRAATTVTKASRFTPRHKHAFDQIRYIISGQAKFGRTLYGAGDCLYMPEGVAYGPEDCSMCDERLALPYNFPDRRRSHFHIPPTRPEPAPNWQRSAGLRGECPFGPMDERKTVTRRQRRFCSAMKSLTLHRVIPSSWRCTRTHIRGWLWKEMVEQP